MSIYHIVTPSLAEDLKALGLVSETETLQESEDFDEETLEAQEADFEEGEEIDFDDEELDEDEDADDDEDDEDIEEGIKVKKAKRKTGSARAAAKRAYRKVRSKKKKAGRRYRKSAKGKRKQAKRGREIARRGGQNYLDKMHKSRKRVYVTGLDHVSDLIEEIQDLVKDVQETDLEEAVTSFVHIRDIAGLIAEAFSYFGNEDEDEELTALGESFQHLAEAAHGYATGIYEHDIDAEGDEVVEAFQGQLHALLDGLEIYESIVDETSDLAEMDDEDDEDDDDEGND